MDDPIVEILRLAYRRGLAIRQEEKRNSVHSENLDQVAEKQPFDSHAVKPSKQKGQSEYVGSDQ